MRYFIFDLDDTLLKDDKTVSEYTQSVLADCQKRGDKIVINSARPYYWIERLELGFEPDYLILNGGAEIYRGNELIYEDKVSPEMVTEIVSELRLRNDIQGFTMQASYAYCDSEDYLSRNSNARLYDYSKPFEEYASKVLIGTDNDEYIQNLAKRYNLQYTRYFNGPWYRLSTTTKAMGQKKLVELLGDSNATLVAFGDDHGDIEMLKAATVGVAMKNSTDAVLREIEETTEFTNDEDGCARYIVKHYFSEMANIKDLFC